MVGLLWYGDLEVDWVMYLYASCVVDMEVGDVCICCRVRKYIVSSCGFVCALCSACVVTFLLAPSLCLCSYINEHVVV